MAAAGGSFRSKRVLRSRFRRFAARCGEVRRHRADCAECGSCSMTIQFGLFVPGLLLLVIPADRLLSAHIELRSFDCFRRLSGGRPFRPWWWVPALWLDPLRAFAGTWLLRSSLPLRFIEWELIAKPEYSLLLAILAFAVIAQTFTRRADHGVLLAPVGFVSGIAAALTPWPVALIGVVTAFVGLFAFRQFHAFFGFGLVATALLGVILDGPMMWILPASGAFALPVMAGLVTSSTLEFPVRAASGPRMDAADGGAPR